MPDRFKVVFRLENWDTKEEVFDLQQAMLDLGEDGIAALAARDAAMKEMASGRCTVERMKELDPQIKAADAAKHALEAVGITISTFIRVQLLAHVPKAKAGG